MRDASLRRVGAVAACVLTVCFVLAGLTRLSVETGVRSFLPTQDASVTALDELARSFGGDPIVVLLESEVERQLLNEDNIAELLQLEGRLSRLPDTAGVYGPATILNQIAGQTQALLAELSGRRDAVRLKAVSRAERRGATAEAAHRAGEQAVQTFDRRYGPLLVQGMPAGLPTLSNPVFVSKAVYNADGAPHARWRFVVPSANSVAIHVRTREGIEAGATSELVEDVRSAVADAGITTSRVTVSGVPTVASAVGDQVSREIPLLGGLALVAVSACFLLIPWTSRRRRIVPVLTTLIAIGLTLAVFGWFDHPLSLGVVAFLPILLGIGSYYATYVTQSTDPRTVLTVAAATSASFAALTLSPLPFVRDLGMALAGGVLAAAIIGVALSRWLVGGRTEHLHSNTRWTWATRPHAAKTMVAALAAAAALGWVLLPGLPLQSDLRSFAGGMPAAVESSHVEQKIGSSGELDVVVHGRNASSVKAFEWMREANNRLLARHGDELSPVLSLPSLLTFLGPSPTREQLSAALRLLPPYLVEAVVRNDSKVAVLTYGVRSDDMRDVQRLRDSVLAELPPPPTGYDVELAGLPLVAARGHELVSDDRLWGNLAGIVAAGLVLAVGLRRRADALRAVTAGLLAAGLGYFALWALGIPLSPVTVALGALTTAVSCEFTILVSDAVRRRDQRLLRSVGLATASSAAGYAVLAASGLAVIREFGLLLAGSVLLSLLSAALVTAASVRVARPSEPTAAGTSAAVTHTPAGATR